MKCSYKFSIDLTKEQAIKSKKIMNACKFVYNYMLELKEYMYKVNNISMSKFELHGVLATLKDIYPCLTEAPSQSLQYVVTNMVQAYTNFLNKISGYPRYKKESTSFVYTQMNSKRNFKGDNIIYIPKLGNIVCNFHRSFKFEDVKTATIKCEDDKWYVILVTEEEYSCKKNIEEVEKDKIIGIDLGISNYVTISNGEVYENPNILKKSESKVKRCSKKLSKKKKSSRNRKRAKIKLNKVHTKIRNQRNDYMHKVTKEIVSKYDVIIVEDLNMQSMFKSKSKGLNKSLANISLYRTIQTLEYKSEKYGKIFVKVEAKNTSKQCSKCGELVEKSLSDRVHICECGLKLDRDINASINILNKGLAMLKIS